MQLYVNDLQNLIKTMKKLYDGTIPMAQTSDTERAYYYNRNTYERNPELYNDLLKNKQSPAMDEFWYVEKQFSSYQQSLEMLTWEDVLANPNLKESLYYASGLAFMLDSQFSIIDQGYDVVESYLGFTNGLYYQTPTVYD